MIRLGLCCLFKEAPIKFRSVTLTNLKKAHLTDGDPQGYLSKLVLHNARALKEAILFCQAHQIGSFRVLSQLLPLSSHPEFAYAAQDLKDAAEILAALEECRQLALKANVRLVFHPDQFILLNSLKEEVNALSIRELEAQNALANLIGADTILIHAGGAFQDKALSLKRLCKNLERLSPSLRQKLSLENDDRSYSPADLLPLCQSEGLPLTYDVHHHRCLPDALSMEEATLQAIKTWPREPLFHISSPINGWQEPKTMRCHHDYIDSHDFPLFWREVGPLTVEVEAKAKELAIAKLKLELEQNGFQIRG
ncbi:MAG: hypothetical protein K0S07_638 [Chlamydiales bacterium]|jgi:UV DNA damage endonuclease|nr:hypothetical protein [Chlamydiales bacterium]